MSHLVVNRLLVADICDLFDILFP